MSTDALFTAYLPTGPRKVGAGNTASAVIPGGMKNGAGETTPLFTPRGA